MSKKRESVTENTPDDAPIEDVVNATEEVAPAEFWVKPAYEQAARELLAQPVDPVELDDIHRVYYSALADARLTGSLEGDAKAIAYRAARTWARENNRRMPDSF